MLGNKPPLKLAVQNNYFIVLMTSLGQGFREGIIRMACLCSRMSGAIAEDDLNVWEGKDLELQDRLPNGFPGFGTLVRNGWETGLNWDWLF